MAIWRKRRGDTCLSKNDAIQRALLITAICLGLAYSLVGSTGVSGAVEVAWKGAGVSLLAIWCAMQARQADGWLLAGVMGFGALGDILLAALGLVAGAAAFAIGHILAMTLYFRNWRPAIGVGQRLLAAMLVPVTICVARLSGPTDLQYHLAAYAFLVSGMTASAWTSRFPRNRTALGATLFLVSDLLIFARLGPLASSALAEAAIWPLYFVGQLLICLGVTATLTGERQSS